jgi:hypothetical protein
MSKTIAFAATLAFLCCDISIVTAADDGGWVTCKDGSQTHGGGACANHGGVLIVDSTSTVIDTTKDLAPTKATTKKSKTQKTAASTATNKKAVSKRSSSPTARCVDGAMYFSTERRGACASHGGVRYWF